MSYQYAIDCLTAGMVYRREFYQDSEIDPKDTMMFTLTFVPFGTAAIPTNQ
jgi:LPS-assembly protein